VTLRREIDNIVDRIIEEGDWDLWAADAILAACRKRLVEIHARGGDWPEVLAIFDGDK
jgi:hypothetical protein